MTPLENSPELAAAVGVSGLYLKREDLHPYGSHKGRSIPVMIDTYLAKGDRSFALSSSGNAALAAALYMQELNAKRADNEKITLDIFVGQHISPPKLEKLKTLTDDHIRVLRKERPLQALSVAIEEGMRSLRQSTDDVALVGYDSLAREIAETKDVGAVFMGTSSGTTAQALAAYFAKHNLPIQVHIVQTSSCHPLADAFDTFDFPPEESLADAIVDQTALRKSALVPLIEKTGGRGWLAKNEDIEAAQELVIKHTGVEISTNSALSIVGAMKAAEMGWEMRQAVVCLICGE